MQAIILKKGGACLVMIAGVLVQELAAIKVINETNKDLFVKVYYVPGESKDKKYDEFVEAADGALYPVPAGQQIDVVRPERKCKSKVLGICTAYFDRDLYFTTDRNNLAPRMQKRVLYDDALNLRKDFVSLNIGEKWGDTFYIAEVDGALRGSNNATKIVQAVTKVSQSVLDAAATIVKNKYDAKDYPGKTQVASVRVGSELCVQEQEYIKNRLPKIKAALEKMLGMQLADNEVPRIALCSSGGGYRAMLATLGSFKGADSVGLLDLSLYNAGLSGSTWAIAGWLQSGQSIKDYVNWVVSNRINQHILTDVKAFTAEGLAGITEAMVKKAAFHQPASLIDFYGALIGDKIVRGSTSNTGNQNDVFLDTKKDIVLHGDAILPICTSIIDEADDYEWAEFTPFEVGTTYINAFVPTWAFGRSFDKGVSVDFSPPQSLGFGMGIWGSAMSVNMRDLVDIFKEDIKPDQLRDLLLTYMDIGKVKTVADFRFYPAKVFNWAYNLGDSAKELSKERVLTMMDAGIDFNLPFPPLLRPERKVDIIIALDSGATVQDAPDLIKAQKHARAHNLRWSEINAKSVNQICSVHHDQSKPNAPIIIYLPLVANPNYANGWEPLKEKFTATSQFSYSPENAQKLCGLTEKNMQDSAEIIKQTIKQFIENRRKK